MATSLLFSQQGRAGTGLCRLDTNAFILDSALLVPLKPQVSSNLSLSEVSKGPHELPETHDLGLVLTNSFDVKPMICILTGMSAASNLLF